MAPRDAPRIPDNFELTVQGQAEIPHPAERAVINLRVESIGVNKVVVSEEVVATAKHIEGLLRELSPKDTSQAAKDAAVLAHWSKTTLSSTSHVPYDQEGKEQPRQYRASIGFDIRFKDFKAIGAFGTKASALSHVEINDIHWILTPATEKSYRSQLRKEAAKDALDKAKDYCEVLGCKNVRPVEIEESAIAPFIRSRSRGGRTDGVFMQSAVGMAGAASGGDGDGQPIINDDLEYDAQEVKMNMSVIVKFIADHA